MKKGNKQKRVENRKLRNTNVYTDDNEMTRLLKIVGAITAFLVVFFILVNIFDPTKKKDEEETKEIQYTNILAANVLEQKPENYYVLVKYEDDNYLSLYEYYLSNYKTNNNGHYYFVDLTNSFNKWALGEENNLAVDKIEDLRFKETALLQISNGKIENSFVGLDSIKNKLIEISRKS